MVNLLHKKSDYPCLKPDLLIKIDNYSEFEFWIWKEEKIVATGPPFTKTYPST